MHINVLNLSYPNTWEYSSAAHHGCLIATPAASMKWQPGIKEAALAPGLIRARQMGRSGDSTARIWDLSALAEGGRATSISLPHSSPDDKEKPKDVTTLDWSGNGALLATGSYDGLARVWSKEGVPLLPLPTLHAVWKGCHQAPGFTHTLTARMTTRSPRPSPPLTNPVLAPC